MKLQFLGAAQTVTGSKTLVTAGKHRFLVDCGLFQGVKDLRLRNWRHLPVEARALDAVLLTHAHLDHCGYLPLLVKQGFAGKIFCTSPTKDLAEIILMDSAHIQEEDAEFANRKGYSKHHPAKPLYTEKDVRETMRHFKRMGAGDWEHLPGGTRFQFTPSGHILGSAFVELETEGRRVVFSGDLGRESPLLYPPPEPIEHADYLVLESTYGDRTHHGGNPAEELAHAIHETRTRGGQVIIPAFAVGRVQDILFLLSGLRARGALEGLPVYVDSPMGTRATEIFEAHPGWHRLGAAEVRALWETATFVESQQQSIQLMREAAPAIVIAGSGMLSGGRVLHHLAARLPQEKNSVILVGFQPAGTRGRLLREGISELKIHGQYVPVHARVTEISALSAHADQSETLTWLRGFKSAPSRTFINHGEPQSSDALRVKLKDELGWSSVIPSQDEQFEL